MMKFHVEAVPLSFNYTVTFHMVAL